jgi:hypothetical protein
MDITQLTMIEKLLIIRYMIEKEEIMIIDSLGSGLEISTSAEIENYKIIIL